MAEKPDKQNTMKTLILYYSYGGNTRRVAQMIQKTDEGHGVPLVFMTHETSAQAMSDALQRTVDAGLLKEPAVYFRVL